jgi:hypothetical protein
MSITKSLSISLDLDALLDRLHQLEREGFQVTGVVGATDDTDNFNLITLVEKQDDNLPILEAKQVTTDAPTIKDLADDGETVVDFSDVFVAGPSTQAIVFFRRDPGFTPSANAMIFSGRISTFGGPDDKGVQPNEGLALINSSNVSQFPEFFLPQQPPGTTGLARRLNNTGSHYIACRWVYKKTPVSFLLSHKVTVSFGGKSILAQPVDFGPAIRTGRIADLSDELAADLGVSTDKEIVTVRIPLPPSAQVVPPGAGADVQPAQPGGAAPQPLTDQQVNEPSAFGKFTFREDPDDRGAIIINAPWVKDNIVTVFVPALAGKAEENRRFSGNVECHIKVAPFLVGAFAEIERRNLADRIVSWAGSFVPRHIDRNIKRSLSLHSWGIAFDINEDANEFGHPPAPAGQPGSVVDLVPIFESFGFFWGGNFKTEKDGMHFEFGRLV